MRDRPTSQRITCVHKVVLRIFLVLAAFCLIFNIEGMFELIRQNQPFPKLQSSQNRLKRPYVPVLYIRDENTTLADEKSWFTGRYRNGAVMIASANFGAANSSLLRNMICSLATNAPLALDALVIWAIDMEAAQLLSNMSTHSYNSSFGVYYYNYTSSLKLPPSYVVTGGDWQNYINFMAGRNPFFERMVGTLEINFIFTDLDVFYMEDPFVALNVPYGVSNVATTSLIEPTGNDTLESLYDLMPDIAYSTDARTFYHLTIDPYEGNTKIPKICGGFFFIRANNRTSRLWTTMREQNLNDQWGMEKLLNNHALGFDSVLVNPLPAGLEKRKDPRNGTDVVDGTQVLRIRILSQAAYRNALPFYTVAGTVDDDYPMYLEELKNRGEYEVLYHPNYYAHNHSK
ncbi:hypothetical protein HDU79_010024 [Rhizoclosmatium sp. JEL0117]|nr:hypothetical protein HDU79_010024 [Rhizoclosmatium sp. JEL0117]